MENKIKVGDKIRFKDVQLHDPGHISNLIRDVGNIFTCMSTKMIDGDEYVGINVVPERIAEYFSWRFEKINTFIRRCYD